jgi:hypothetical protein
MSEPSSVLDLEAEAEQISVQAVPGALFFRLRREREDGTIRRMFIEMSVAGAIAFRRELDASIRTAAATSGP